MRYLIVSDIHANLEGLNAVLAANEGLYDQILCCGDFVDYCASPNEICDWARTHCEVVIRGNHDKACCGLDDTDDYNPLAQAAVSGRLHRNFQGYSTHADCDLVALGVSAIGADGQESMISAYVSPVRKDAPIKRVP